MSSYNRMIKELSELVQSEHCEGCSDETCDIRACFDTGYSLWAIYLLDSAGAGGDRFENLMGKLTAQYGVRFERAAERERAAFIEATPYIVCDTCNAHTWLTPYVDADYYADPDAACANCGGEIHREVTANEKVS